MPRGKLVKTGALWAKSGKSFYHSGVFECHHCQAKTNILVFDNNYKENDNQPDKIINRSEEEGAAGLDKTSDGFPTSTEDDAPF